MIDLHDINHFFHPFENALKWLVIVAGGYTLFEAGRTALFFSGLKSGYSKVFHRNFMAEWNNALWVFIFAVLAVTQALPLVPSWIQSLMRLVMLIPVAATTRRVRIYRRDQGHREQ